MHREFRKLLDSATGISQHVIAIVIDIRGFTPFCNTVDSLEVATYIKKVYMKIIDAYFPDASFYKPTGDGLLVIVPYAEDSLEQVINKTIESCKKLVEDFGNLCVDEPMINFDTPKNIGIGITRGSACCLASGEKVLDYSGKVLNLASRLMDTARPSGIVFDSKFGLNLLSKDNRELFLEDRVYIRGIAEQEPIIICYTRNFTIISDSYKKPIIEPRLDTVENCFLFKELKELPPHSPRLAILLEHKPIDVEKIEVKLMFEFVSKDTGKSFSHTLWRKVGEKEVYYRKRGKEHMVQIELKPLIEILNSRGLDDDTEITVRVIYPTI